MHGKYRYTSWRNQVLYKHSVVSKSVLESAWAKIIPSWAPDSDFVHGTISSELQTRSMVLPNSMEQVCLIAVLYVCRWHCYSPVVNWTEKMVRSVQKFLHTTSGCLENRLGHATWIECETITSWDYVHCSHAHFQNNYITRYNYTGWIDGTVWNISGKIPWWNQWLILVPWVHPGSSFCLFSVAL